jgi:hypothetical protein
MLNLFFFYVSYVKRDRKQGEGESYIFLRVERKRFRDRDGKDRNRDCRSLQNTCKKSIGDKPSSNKNQKKEKKGRSWEPSFVNKKQGGRGSGREEEEAVTRRDAEKRVKGKITVWEM